MRRLTLLTVLILLALPTPTRPTRAARQCPAVRVSCPDAVRGGEHVDFNAALDPSDAVKLTYLWEISAGTVVKGRGTSSLKVDTTGLGGQTLVATVEVDGLGEGCSRSASCETAVISDPIGCGFDEYGDIAFDDEKARLDNFAVSVQSDPTALGHLICYGGRRGYEGEAMRRCERAKDYLSAVRGIELARIVTVDGGFRESLTVKLTIVPAGASTPTPDPTVEPGEVLIIKRAARGASRRRRPAPRR